MDVNLSVKGGKYVLDYSSGGVVQEFTVVLPDIEVPLPQTIGMEIVGARTIIKYPVRILLSLSEPLPIGEVVAGWDKELFDKLFAFRDTMLEQLTIGIAKLDPKAIAAISIQAMLTG